MTYVPMTLQDAADQHIINTLVHTNFNKSQAAVILDVPRSTVIRRLRKLSQNMRQYYDSVR